jgi:hypothetical protein
MDFPTASAHITTRKQMVRYHMRAIPKTKKHTGLMTLHGNNRAVFDLFPLIKGLKIGSRFNLFKIAKLQLWENMISHHPSINSRMFYQHLPSTAFDSACSSV